MKISSVLLGLLSLSLISCGGGSGSSSAESVQTSVQAQQAKVFTHYFGDGFNQNTTALDSSTWGADPLTSLPIVSGNKVVLKAPNVMGASYYIYPVQGAEKTRVTMKFSNTPGGAASIIVDDDTKLNTGYILASCQGSAPGKVACRLWSGGPDKATTPTFSVPNNELIMQVVTEGTKVVLSVYSASAQELTPAIGYDFSTFNLLDSFGMYLFSMAQDAEIDNFKIEIIK